MMTELPRDSLPDPAGNRVAGLSRLMADGRRIRVVIARHSEPSAAAFGLLVGLTLALWSSYEVAATAPLITRTEGGGPATGLGWDPDQGRLVVGLADAPLTALPDGSVVAVDPRLALGSGVVPPAQRDALAGVLPALSRVPASDGVLTVRAASFELVTPGGLVAVDGNGAVLVAGTARVRDLGGGQDRPIGMESSDSRSVWRLAAAPGEAQGAPTQASPTGGQPSGGRPWVRQVLHLDAPVTALLGLPGKGRVAIGGSDGSVAIVDDDSPRYAPSKTGLGRSHRAPVVALAASWNGMSLASAASDGSVKVWRLASSSDPQAWDLAFAVPPGRLALAADSVTISAGGETLLVRTPTGAAYVSRIAVAQGLESAPGPLLAVPLDAPAVAAALSGDGQHLYAAGTDCLIREIDLSSILATTRDGTAGAPVLTVLRGHGAPVHRLAPSPDGTFLAAASIDGRIRIHRLDRSRALAKLPFADLPTGPACAVGQETLPSPGFVRRDYRVFVQFAGSMSRTDMINFAQALRTEGWNVQGTDRGGERTSAAAGSNEVRYGPTEDREAAEDLAGQASQLRSTGLQGPQLRTVANESITRGTLELWISSGPQSRN